MPLSNIQCKQAKPEDKQYKLHDEKGLYLLVTKTGKHWRFDYRYEKKRKTLALGSYPEITLYVAREQLADARRLLVGGVDPSAHRKAEKESERERNQNTFQKVALEWHAKQAPPIWTESHHRLVLRILENYLFPIIGDLPIADIGAKALLEALRPIETRGAVETAHRARTIASQVFRYAIAVGKADRDVAADLRGALTPIRVKHHPALTDPEQVSELMRAIDGYAGTLTARCALRLLPLVFTRPGEVRHMEWAEVHTDKAMWEIPAGKMKMREPHMVPLSHQALSILEEMRPLSGEGKYVFPGERSKDRPMSENTINAALRRMGYTKDQMTGHGFRAMARTMLEERLDFRVEWIEQQVAHTVKDPLGRAYNRTKHLEERQRMMQAWADYLDELRANTPRS